MKPSKPKAVYEKNFSDAMDEFAKVVKSADELAEAAHRVQADHDGVHRLRLALANWYTVRANEFGRVASKSSLGRKL